MIIINIFQHNPLILILYQIVKVKMFKNRNININKNYEKFLIPIANLSWANLIFNKPLVKASAII